MCTLLSWQERNSAASFPPFISGHLSGFKDCCGSEARGFQYGFSGRGHERGQAAHMSREVSAPGVASVLLFNEVYSLEDGRRLWI